MKRTRQAYLMIAVLLALSPCLLAAPSGNLISYQGRVVDANGVPLADGNYSATFRLYVDGAPTSFLETLTVAVKNGVFTTYLGGTSALPAFETSREYQLGVKVGAGTEVKQAIAAVPLARTALTSNMASSVPGGMGVPVGGVIMYWGNSASLPAGFELCDGTAVTTAGSSLLGQAKPNLVNKFARGATGDVRTTPVTGGTDTLAHKHNYAIRYRTSYRLIEGEEKTIIQARRADGTYGEASDVALLDNSEVYANIGGKQSRDLWLRETVGATTEPIEQLSNVPSYVGLLYIMRVL